MEIEGENDTFVAKSDLKVSFYHLFIVYEIGTFNQKVTKVEENVECCF